MHYPYRLQHCEEDKLTKDSQIRSLKDELVSQEELVIKLQKEKKAWADGRQQKEEELQAAEDKTNHLTKIKIKLEQNLDELEDSVEREKKVLFYCGYTHFLKVLWFFLSVLIQLCM
jgi:myosin heavy chain 6/7